MPSIRMHLFMLTATLTMVGCASGNVLNEPLVRVVLPDQVDFVPLNPARGDASPKAGVLWGDIRANVPSGVFLKFADGFSSPPHIHNITYRAVVISGHLHNDDPDAAMLWMPPGSFWTQPAGEVHITAAKSGAPATAFLEIQTGPYLVRHPDQAFDNGEQAINVVTSNLVWLDASASRWISVSANNEPGTVSLSHLWGTPGSGLPAASMIRIRPGGQLTLTGAKSLKMVVVSGQLDYSHDGSNRSGVLPAGAYIDSDAGVTHSLGCVASTVCLAYVRSEGMLDFRSIH
ncbi:MAG: DUF4437 domain-containing protein [Pseudomonadota bacterium]